MKLILSAAGIVAMLLGTWPALDGGVRPVSPTRIGDGDTIVAADLEPGRAELRVNRRVWIRGELVRLGLDEIDEDFGVADATGIAPLDLDPELVADTELLEALLKAHQVEVGGLVEIDARDPSDSARPRIAVSRAEDIVLHVSPPYPLLAQGLSAIALALLIAYLVTRQRYSERRAAEIAAFTHELKRREEILEAVGYGAEQFLRSESWEAGLPAALERLGRAARVTRASVYGIAASESGPTVSALGEWIEERIVEGMGDAARSDLALAQMHLPRWVSCFLRNEVVMGNTPELPESERAYLETRGIHSIIAIPIQVGGMLGGLLLLTDHLQHRQWPAAEREALLIAAGMIGAAMERRRTEAALAEAEARFAQMAEHIREVFFMTDARTFEVLYLSPAYEEIWGRTRDEALTEPLAFIDAILPEDRHLMFEDVRKSATGRGASERQFEYRIRRPDGAIRWIRNRSFQIYGEDGQPHRVAGVCTDITEQKQLEEELRRANRIEAMGHLAAGIAHEINTPIQYIGGNLEFLDDSFADLRIALDAYRALLADASDGPVPAERIAEIRAIVANTDIDFIVEEAPRASSQALDGVKRVSEIVRAMKEFSHPGSGSRVLMDLNQAIRSTTTVARNEWKYVAELVTELDPALPMVACLPGEVNQAILNLVVNAAHAIADRQRAEGHYEPGTITVRTGIAGDWVEIRVSDTGTGIPEEIRQRIFDPFFTTKEVGRGTGQGLTFVHSIVVEQHGGTVTFETEGGVGTTFIVRLPYDAGRPDLSEAA